jgi:DNA-binding transcriptional ArsR family regulator
VDRATAGGYLRAAGIPVRGRGRPGERVAKPAISVEVSTDSTLEKPAICERVSPDAASRASEHASLNWSGLDIFRNGNMIAGVPRAATSSDVFNAVAEPQRRAILNFLAADEHPVSDIVDALVLAQPSVSKHLRVLRDVGLVRARRDGRQVWYRTNASAIRPLHEWAGTFERYWRHQLTRIKERAEGGAKTR